MESDAIGFAEASLGWPSKGRGPYDSKDILKDTGCVGDLAGWLEIGRPVLVLRIRQLRSIQIQTGGMRIDGKLFEYFLQNLRCWGSMEWSCPSESGAYKRTTWNSQTCLDMEKQQDCRFLESLMTWRYFIWWMEHQQLWRQFKPVIFLCKFQRNHRQDIEKKLRFLGQLGFTWPCSLHLH